MADAGAEKHVREIIDNGEFTFENKSYKVIQNHKPSRETKTDFYLVTKDWMTVRNEYSRSLTRSQVFLLLRIRLHQKEHHTSMAKTGHEFYKSRLDQYRMRLMHDH